MTLKISKNVGSVALTASSESEYLSNTNGLVKINSPGWIAKALLIKYIRKKYLKEDEWEFVNALLSRIC